jgi:hypothetical protein
LGNLDRTLISDYLLAPLENSFSNGVSLWLMLISEISGKKGLGGVDVQPR